jgi:hypothetical protein
VASDLGTAFEVQLTYVKNTGCNTLDLNDVVVTVYSSAITKTPVVDPGGITLASQGNWGSIITYGGNEQNGDAYAPYNNGGGSGFPISNSPANTVNQKYDGDTTSGGGYQYVVNLPAGGHVNLFDPGFCAMGGNPSGAGDLGSGDHWIAGTPNPVSTYYTLWNTNGDLGAGIAAWTPVYTSGTLFADETGYDPANGSSPGTGATEGCANEGAQGADNYHDTWWTIPTGTLAPGTYILQIATTNPTDSVNPPPYSDVKDGNTSTNAENMFSIEVIGGSGTDANGNTVYPTVYGNGKMAVYNNLQPGTGVQQFYLAQIGAAAGAGKTALIDLFDPGDVPGDSTLQILSPDSGTQTPVAFTYTTDSNCQVTSGSPGSAPCSSATAVTSIQTASGGVSSFNNTWIYITIPLPSSYGSTGLWDACKLLGTGSCPGWWQIKYTTDKGANDTTTWQVSLEGNPVHLVVP